jgi:MinD superfamily P-loop ATPase
MIKLNKSLCGRCGGCVAVCEYDALELNSDGLLIKEELCTLCNNCVIFCPSKALRNEDEKRI